MKKYVIIILMIFLTSTTSAVTPIYTFDSQILYRQIASLTSLLSQKHPLNGSYGIGDIKSDNIKLASGGIYVGETKNIEFDINTHDNFNTS